MLIHFYLIYEIKTLSIHSLEGETPVNIVDALIQLKSSTLRYINFVIAKKINILVKQVGMEKQCFTTLSNL